MFVYLLTGLTCMLWIKFLRLFDTASKPRLYHSGSHFTKEVISRCASFLKVYHPPMFWGKCGHIQTAIYGKLGRINPPTPRGTRHMITMSSGETVTYDVFQPSQKNKFVERCTVLVCPGICNSSEKKYIRTFVQYAVEKGYHLAVLNHIGVLPSVKLTSPKIFTYGETKYFASMADEVKRKNPSSTFIIVGFSMGGNIIARYLGEDKARQESVLCALSLCQGYDGLRSTTALNQGFRKIYSYLISLNFKKTLKPHWRELFHVQDDEKVRSYDENKVKFATSMYEIEDGLLRHFGGFSSRDAYMGECGCADVIDNIDIPILLLNSEDDPLVVPDVHDVPMKYCRKKDNALFLTTKHGGHLGFYQGSWYWPNDITLLENFIMEYIEAVLDITTSSEPSQF
ncbi:monoacylglycerol lipase ABHD2-like [Clavelina lepadiformis]|uniref:monoacylglycerol lipase ABHD2-like n=1 Tax=Clavelina lepadiformis TaxID=159417 RepID=UPI004042595B